MSLDCKCNRLMEAEAKASKWDALVRCGKCRALTLIYAGETTVHRCELLNIDTNPRLFCAWAERRES